MATINIELTITTPQGISISDAVLYYSKSQGYVASWLDINGKTINNPETPVQFTKKRIAAHIEKSIRSQRLQESQQLAIEQEQLKPQITVE